MLINYVIMFVAGSSTQESERSGVYEVNTKISYREDAQETIGKLTTFQTLMLLGFLFLSFLSGYLIGFLCYHSYYS